MAIVHPFHICISGCAWLDDDGGYSQRKENLHVSIFTHTYACIPSYMIHYIIYIHIYTQSMRYIHVYVLAYIFLLVPDVDSDAATGLVFLNVSHIVATS